MTCGPVHGLRRGSGTVEQAGPAPAFPDIHDGRERDRAMTAQDDKALSAEEVQTLQGLLARLEGRGAELPWPLFRFITEVVATANVDLLVRDPARGVLLAWRDDSFGQGWHVPGSIIRHREEIGHRIAACARDEFGCEVAVDEGVAAVIQIFDDRGHSVSLCYRATLRGPLGRRLVGAEDRQAPGDLRWFKAAPPDLYPSHRVYREVMAAIGPDERQGGAPLFTQHVGRRDAAQADPEGMIGADATLS